MPLGNDKLLDQIFNLKFTSKQLVKSSSKCEKEEKTEKLKVAQLHLLHKDSFCWCSIKVSKPRLNLERRLGLQEAQCMLAPSHHRVNAVQVKKAIEKGNIDGAKIYAQNAIRKKTEALNYLRLASRLDAVVSRLDTQAKMNMINSSMSQIVRALDRVSSNSLWPPKGTPYAPPKSADISPVFLNGSSCNDE